MSADTKNLERLLKDSSAYDTEYLYFLLGNVATGRKFTAQGSKQAAAAGKGFFKKFSKQFKGIICSKDGPYKQFIEGMISKKDLPKLIAIAILNGASVVEGVAITQAIAVYLALLVIQAGLAAYCDPREE